ncbi:hypothetical protein ACFFQF_05305 [Haladaptatus pallidirubidus]|uniref:hypothetical protein n=1 Tax=Haladaptatus pallidirubidus TaxID=1008152 RepID=UPI001D123365|nr:hypothetical protein [Haladaptatus pallidirubidus]
MRGKPVSGIETTVFGVLIGIPDSKRSSRFAHENSVHEDAEEPPVSPLLPASADLHPVSADAHDSRLRRSLTRRRSCVASFLSCERAGATIRQVSQAMWRALASLREVHLRGGEPKPREG